MRSRVFFKLLGAFVLVIAVATAILDVTIRREWESSLRQQITDSLTEKTRMFEDRVDANGGATPQIVAQQGVVRMSLQHDHRAKTAQPIEKLQTGCSLRFEHAFESLTIFGGILSWRFSEP